MEEKGTSTIIYDRRGSYFYFLIVHNLQTGWEFVKGSVNEGESAQEAAARILNNQIGLRKFDVKGNLIHERDINEDGKMFTTFIVEANMNVTVDISDTEIYDNYLWTTKERVLEKLSNPLEKTSFSEALIVLQNNEF